MSIKIEVKQEHIDKGAIRNACHCAVALACKEVATDKDSVWCELEYVDIDGRAYDLPTRARRFIEAFDHDLPVEPFSFDLSEGL